MFKIAMPLTALLLVTTVNTQSAQACQAEAQVIAPIARIEKSMTSCKVFIDPTQVRFFASSIVCPLDLSEIVSEGVEVGLQNGHDCKADVGTDLNGVVVRPLMTGRLVLE